MLGELGLDKAFLERETLRRAGKPVEIARTERLLVRETTPEDVPALYAIGKAPGMEDYVQPMLPTLEEEEAFMRAYIRNQYRFYDFGLWSVLEQESGRVVGRAGLFVSELLPEAVEMGYLIARDCQGRGYASECGRAIVGYAAEVLGFSQLHILADIRNTPSVRVAGKLGFSRRETIRRGSARMIHFVRELTEKGHGAKRDSFTEERERGYDPGGAADL